jgi:hypothetical protein
LQGLDGDEFDLESFCQLCKFLRAHHSAIVPHDLAAKPALFQPCQTAQVYGGFCVAVPFQNTIFPC